MSTQQLIYRDESIDSTINLLCHPMAMPPENHQQVATNSLSNNSLYSSSSVNNVQMMTNTSNQANSSLEEKKNSDTVVIEMKDVEKKEKDGKALNNTNQNSGQVVQQQIINTHSDIVLFNNPKMVLEKLKADGIRKSKLTIDQLIILSLFAGIFKGLACSMAVLVGGNVAKLEEENPGLQKLLTGAVFPVGLMLIVLTGSELFTGNVLVLLIGLFSRKWRAKKFLIQYAQFSKNLFVSFIFNCLGAYIFAYFFIYLPQPCCSAHWITYVQNLAVAKTTKTFGNLVLLGIICNMLVTVAIFNANAATTLGGKVVGIWFPIMSFVSLGFEHSIANAFFIPLGMHYGANVTVYDFLIGNLLPVTIGNIIGGAILNACLIYYVHDFRARHNRVLFNTLEKLWKIIKSRISKSNTSSPAVTTGVEMKVTKSNV